jgi:tetratricopeptide (TPR) repeat protein/HAMP domain-containing protein
MKIHVLLGALLLLLAPGSAWGQSPDDRYVRVYSLIEAADKQSESGQSREALTKYLEAQVAIKELQQTYPEWKPRLVSFRLEYISSKLEPLAKKVAAGGAAATENATPAPRTAPAPADRITLLEEEIKRLALQNAHLEARLREALTVQPAAIDPRELAKAESKIKELQKERDLLVVSLEQAGRKPTAPAANQNADADAKRNAATQTAVVGVLRKQNEDLQRQITELVAKLRQSGKLTPASEETLRLRETVAALEASNRVLKEETTSMENRLVQFVRQHGPGPAARNVELQRELVEARQAARTAAAERDALIQRLNEVTKQLNQRDTGAPTVATRQLEQQLEGIRAKLQIFEAKQVPFTAEELALFKQAPLKVAAAQTNAPAAPKISNEVPPGAGPLVAAALRAIDAGRLDEAEGKYKELVRQHENNTYLLANLAAVQMDQDKMTDAESTLKRALAIDSQDAVSLYLFGGLKLRQDKVEEALDALSLSAKLDPDKANTQYFLGKALIQTGNRGPAETALRKAIQLRPNWGDAHYLLSVLYTTQEPNFKELAQYHYKKAIAGGAARNLELEQLMVKPPAAAKK